MAISKKGKRKINFRGRQYLWYVQDTDRQIPEEGGFVDHTPARYLHIIGSKKQLIVHYRIPQTDDPYAVLRVEGPLFPRLPGAKEVKVPRWKYDSKRYPTNDFVRRLVQWCLEPDT